MAPIRWRFQSLFIMALPSLENQVFQMILKNFFKSYYTVAMHFLYHQKNNIEMAWKEVLLRERDYDLNYIRED